MQVQISFSVAWQYAFLLIGWQLERLKLRVVARSARLFALQTSSVPPLHRMFRGFPTHHFDESRGSVSLYTMIYQLMLICMYCSQVVAFNS